MEDSPFCIRSNRFFCPQNENIPHEGKIRKVKIRDFSNFFVKNGRSVPFAGRKHHGDCRFGGTIANRTCLCRGAACRSRHNAADTNRLPLKWYAPIASAAALVVQGRRAREKCSGAQRAPCRLAMVAAQIQRRKASRFVIARPRRGRGNLGKAVTILSELACYPPGSCEIPMSLRSPE